MSYNTFGLMFRVTTWGESHGPALGCVIDGCPPGIALSAEDIQHDLNRRRPGTSRFVTQRREPDQVRILSGVFAPEGGVTQTTGTPICLMIENVDQRPRDYSEVKDKFRPGHADYGYDRKYGIRDYRGGGRASARETAARVAAGAVARKVVGADVVVRAAVIQIGPHAVDWRRWDWDSVSANPFFCPDMEAAQEWEHYLDGLRREGSSAGAVIHVEASPVPAGWGAPVYGKLDSAIAEGLMSINAVKAVEIGAGFQAGSLSGQDNADQMRIEEGLVSFLSNNNGGIAGGISTGQPIVARMTVKPTSSIRIARKSISASGDNVEVSTTGRHDPCVGIRAAPVAEAMLACVLADHRLRHRGQTGRDPCGDESGDTGIDPAVS